jgi:PBP1b-binding outer membrane lipoprotein LpoB
MKKNIVISLIVVLALMVVGCKYEYNYYNEKKTPQPTFNQIFAFFTVDDLSKNEIKAIHESMADEELIDLKYNYYSPVPVFGIRNNEYNPRDTIYYKGNVINIRGTPAANAFAGLFMIALEDYKNDDLNKLL